MTFKLSFPSEVFYALQPTEKKHHGMQLVEMIQTYAILSVSKRVDHMFAEFKSHSHAHLHATSVTLTVCDSGPHLLS